jgi:hypothetical protein
VGRGLSPPCRPRAGTLLDVKLPKLSFPGGLAAWRRVSRSPLLPWVLAVALLATTLTNWWFLRHERSDDARTDRVTATARDFLHALTSFSADTIERDVERIRSFAVGDFAQQVDQTFSSDRIQQIRQAKVVSESTVRSVFVESVEADSASVFGVVDESVTNNVSSTRKSDVLRVEVRLIETVGGWKVEQVNILQTPGQTVVPTG